jgi:hypothetical protein
LVLFLRQVIDRVSRRLGLHQPIVNGHRKPAVVLEVYSDWGSCAFGKKLLRISILAGR